MRIAINDLYLAAYLMSNGITLAAVQHSPYRSTLILEGSDINQLRSRYEQGTVIIDLRKLKKNYNRVRSAIKSAYPTNRRAPCPESRNKSLSV